jgi:mRNA-degrading endonuclease RelE of RelBE toxin-antitoxin system
MACYSVILPPEVRLEIRNLPGNLRPRVIQVLEELKSNPIPAKTKKLETMALDQAMPPGFSLYRTRLDNWRIIYVVEEEFTLITILAIRKRPPYQYEDFQTLVDRLLES